MLVSEPLYTLLTVANVNLEIKSANIYAGHIYDKK